MVLRHRLVLGLVLLLSGCASERHFAADSLWPFGNPNAPRAVSETAQRSLGKTPHVTPIAPQAGDVWPGPVQPMPTLSDIQKNANQPLGQSFTPSLPSPYPPGQEPAPGASAGMSGGNLYAVPPGAAPQVVPPASDSGN
jgi:hypothetical protein